MHRHFPVKTLLLILALPIISAAAPTSLQFLQSATQVLTMANGAVLSLGANSLLSINDATGKQIASLPSSALGSESGITAAAIDATGNIWIIGSTQSADFPLVHPFYSTLIAGNITAFVAKLSPGLTILFSSFLQGDPVNGQTNVDAIALDNAGNAYIAGDTTDSNFPTTGPIFGAGAPSTSGFGPRDTFIAEISADATKLVYSRLLGATKPECTGGSACEQVAASTVPAAVTVDQAGSVVVAGSTNAWDFPVTVTPYPNGQGAFIARIAPGGGRMNWSTEVGSQFLEKYGPQVQSVAVDSSGNVYLAGTALGAIAGTPNSLQPTVTRVTGLPSDAFVMKFSADGTQMLYGTNLGGGSGSSLAGMILDSSGTVWVTGFTASADFPGLSNVPGSGVDFALKLNSDGSALKQIFSFLPGTAGSQPSFDSFGRLLLIGNTGNLLRWNPDAAATGSALFALTSSAVPLSMGGAAPGELATFYGVGLGPSQGMTAMPDADGFYPTTLGGVTVGFSAGIAVIPAPLLYVGPNQINFQVPFGVNATTPVIVTTPSGQLPTLQFQALGSVGIFGVINPDGSINSASNPAPVGSAVAIYATGLGAPEPSSRNGAISSTANNAFANVITVQNENPFGALTVLYAGAAPTLINGLDQINVQLPPRLGASLIIETANAHSNQITVYTH